ncbi:MAG: phosphatidate cytidylyltransferase [Acidimicrobiaceae bacterium]|nr:phosphatidate cytidylyltransferase [Acidimicrobiaceae bacterium]
MDESHERDESLSPRPQAEGVRIIRAEEAQAALEAGQAAGRQPDDAPRFGDVPPPPSGPRSPHRFPLPDSVDPASAVPRPAVRPPERRFGGRLTNRAKQPEPVRAPSPPRVVRLLPPSESDTHRIAPEPERESADAGWPVETGWSDDLAPTAAQPLTVGASTDGPKHFAKDPLGSREPSWETVGAAAAGSESFTASIDPPEPPRSRPAAPAYEPSPAALPPDAPDLALPDEGINVHSGSMPELQHWTDPPTGEVPFIRPERESSQGEEMAAWQALGSRGLRWRDEASDWDDLDDVSQLADDEPRLGALDTSRTEHSDMFSFDEQFERLEDERSGPAPVLDPVLDEPPPLQPASRRPAPRRPGPLAARPPRRSGPSPRPPGGGGRDLPTATVVGVGMLLALCFAYVLGAAVLMLLATVIVTASSLELYNLIQHRGFRPATLLGVCATVALMLSAYWRGEVSVPLILALVFITSMLWYMFGVVDARPVVNVGLTVMTFVWIGVFGSYASLLLRVHNGKQLLLLPVLVTVAADTAAYFAGSSIGNRPLAPSISPGKTWEGVIGGGLGAIVLSFILSRLPFLSKTWSGKHSLLLGLVIAVVAPLGDLCESMVKRDLDLKDSGSVLPGHGGLLDRFDALLFVLPATYYLALYLKLG